MKPRDRRTLIPAFNPAELAKEIEQEANRTTVSPPFDPSSYARIVEDHISIAGAAHDSPGTMAAAAKIAAAVATPGFRGDVEIDLDADADADADADSNDRDFGIEPNRRRTMTAPTPPALSGSSMENENTFCAENAETIGREMYGSYLASDFPEALVLAERLLEQEPDHALAQLVLERCKERLSPSGRTLSPSSVLRLKFSELERQSSRIDPTSSFVLGHIDGISDAATVAALTGLDNNDALSRLHALLDLGVLELVSA